MKTNICDVCHAEGKMVESRYRSGFKGGMKVDLCVAHRNWAKQFKDNSELIKGWLALKEQKI